MSSDALVCAVDIGTSSVRAAFVDPSGATLAEKRTLRRDAAAQFDAEELWQQVAGTLRSLTAESAVVPAALAIAGHVGTVLLDSSDRPVGEAGGWSDERGVGDLRAVWERDRDAFRRCGRVTPTGGAVALLAWLRRTDPTAAASVRSVLAPKDFINLRLTGERASDITSAAYTFALDVGAAQWDGDVLAATDLRPELFAGLFPATGLIGTVGTEAAGATGLPPGLPVAAGGPDGTVGAAAILGTDAGSIVDIAGTTDVLVHVTDRPAASTGGRVVLNPYLVPGRWSHGGPTGMTGGAVTRWVGLLAGSPEREADLLRDAVDRVPPGADGLRALPHLTGSRFPTWREDETGGLLGLRPTHGPAHIVRAVHEGAAFAVREAIDVLDPAGALPVLLAGGVAKSARLVQLRADVLGREVHTRTAPDASLLGAARLAQVAAGVHASLDEAVAAGRLPTTAVLPDPSAHAQYDAAYRSWRAVREAMLAAI